MTIWYTLNQLKPVQQHRVWDVPAAAAEQRLQDLPCTFYSLYIPCSDDNTKVIIQTILQELPITWNGIRMEGEKLSNKGSWIQNRWEKITRISKGSKRLKWINEWREARDKSDSIYLYVIIYSIHLWHILSVWHFLTVYSLRAAPKNSSECINEW
jgi:hypothetical protein